MKKRSVRYLTLFLVLLLALGLSGCGADSPKAARDTAFQSAYTDSYNGLAAASAESYRLEPEMWETVAEEDNGGVGGSAAPLGSKESSSMAEKIIYSANITLESTDYDSAIEKINALVQEMGGYMESSSVSGSNYWSISRGVNSNRSASFTIRIPSGSFDRFTGTLSDIGNVPYCNTYTENITTQYYDVQSRLTAYKTQETRLLEMLSIAESVDDMLAIQQQLTEVQYEIDSLTSRLRYFDNKVGYSTVYLNLEEVTEYTPEPVEKLSYWQKMSMGFQQSLKNVGEFFTGLLLWIISNLPALITIAAVLLVLWKLVLRRLLHSGNRKERCAARKARKSEKRALRLAKKNGKKTAVASEEKKPEGPAE